LAEGWAYLKMANFERTLKPLLKLVNFFPESANTEEAYFLLGQAYIMLEQYDKAIESYNKIVQLFPNNLQSESIIKTTNSCLALEQDKIEKLKVQILIEESKLLTTLPINVGDDGTPKHLIKEQKKLEEYRDGLINALLGERDNIGLLQVQIDTLRKLADRKERRKDWRGYAEYGISRALFLKELSQRAN
jgi:tetratricopeptide (TPR) repeat protein